MSAYFADITSATVTWDYVHTLLPLLDIFSRPSFHRFPTQCVFSFENGPVIETVSKVSAFLADIPDTWIMRVPWYIVSEEGRLILDGFIME
jgi:hypothetical protein